MPRIKNERRNALRRAAGIASQGATISGLVLMYWACQDPILETIGAGVNMLGYICEHLVEHYENEQIRDELNKDSIATYNKLVLVNSQIATTTASSTKLKIYGIEKRTLPTSLATFFNITANLSGGALTVANAFTSLLTYKAPAIALSTTSVALHWLHQKWIHHNLDHEKGMYDEANSEIVNVLALNAAAPTSAKNFKR